MCYGELERTSNRIACALQAVGRLRGDRIALLLTKSPKTLATMFGGRKADGIYVPVDPASPPSRISQILSHCGCRCIVADRSTASKLNELMLNGSIPLSTRILWLDQCVDLPTGIRAMFCWDHLAALSDRRVESRKVHRMQNIRELWLPMRRLGLALLRCVAAAVSALDATVWSRVPLGPR